MKVIVKNAGLPEFIAYGNIIGEFVAPLFILVGFKTRMAAAVVAFNMLLSILIAHPDIMFSINDYGGWMIETNMLYMMTAVVLNPNVNPVHDSIGSPSRPRRPKAVSSATPATVGGSTMGRLPSASRRGVSNQRLQTRRT